MAVDALWLQQNNTEFDWSYLHVEGYGDVPYVEKVGSPEESFSFSQGGRARRTFLVPWRLRWYFVAGMVGWSKLVEDGGSNLWISRVPPQPYPGTWRVQAYGYGKSWLYATNLERMVGLKPLGRSTDLAKKTIQQDKQVLEAYQGLDLFMEAPGDWDFWDLDFSWEDWKWLPPELTDPPFYVYQYAEVTVGYETLTYAVHSDAAMRSDKYKDQSGISRCFTHDGLPTGNPDESLLRRYVTRHVVPVSEYLTLPFGQFRYKGKDGQGEKIAATGNGWTFPNSEVQYTWHQVPAIPEAIYRHIGTVNNGAFPDFSPSLTPRLANMDQQFKYETQDMPTTYRPKSFATGTLLLTGVDLKTYRGIGGQFLCDITYKMKHFSALAPKTTTQPPPLPVVPAGSTYTPERGHNYILRWDHVTEQGGQKKFTYSYDLIMNDDNAMIYREKDFAELFRPI